MACKCSGAGMLICWKGSSGVRKMPFTFLNITSQISKILVWMYPKKTSYSWAAKLSEAYMCGTPTSNCGCCRKHALMCYKAKLLQYIPASSLHWRLLASLLGTTQASVKQTRRLSFWTPAIQPSLHWAGQASPWPAWRILKRVCGQVTAGITTFFKAELDKRINLPRPGWNLGRAEHFLCRDGGELNIAWIRTVTARDHERQSRQGHCGTRKNCDGSYLLWSL